SAATAAVAMGAIQATKAVAHWPRSFSTVGSMPVIQASNCWPNCTRAAIIFGIIGTTQATKASAHWANFSWSVTTVSTTKRNNAVAIPAAALIIPGIMGAIQLTNLSAQGSRAVPKAIAAFAT